MARVPSLHWSFPLPTCHHGLPLGNGRLGALVWGEGSTLRITLGRADLWDHRGGLHWTREMSYARIRTLLESGDEKGLRGVFETGDTARLGPASPTILPLGRVELTLPSPLVSGDLDERQGLVRLRTADGAAVELEIAAAASVLLLRSTLGRVPLRVIPAATIARDTGADPWKDRGLPEPQPFDRDDMAGFVQTLPADPAVAVGCRWTPDGLLVAVERAPDASAAIQRVAGLLDRSHADLAGLRDASRRWWAAYWERCPVVRVPNPTLAFLARYGLYRLAASTHPAGVPCGLQGPWIEDDRIPAWSADYHFNINVQMCYSPAVPAGAGEHLRPLWAMLRSWEPQLRENARLFVGIDDGLMLPHAVDDRGISMGGFWTGTVDHGCTAWVARMMFDAWDNGLEDDAFLRSTAFGWLVGALNVYRAMAQRRADGTWSLPVSVSPEYRGSAMNAWGANASFQLAACHSLLDALDQACQRLGCPYDPVWAEFRANLPAAAIEHRPGARWDDVSGDVIALWEGTRLEQSHRHHSHLAAITPFRTLDPLSPQWRLITDTTLGEWVGRGMGAWSGWCMSWASQIHTRVGNAPAAEFLLEAFVRYFCNEGNGMYHGCLHPGLTLMGGSGLSVGRWNAMQLDGGQGSCSAVLDMLAHDRRGTVALFAGCPNDWADVGFDRLHLPGGFVVSATRTAGRLARLEIRSLRGGIFRYLDPSTGQICEIPTQPGQTVRGV